ncbi:MAG: hypothetical protein ACHQF2_06875, partial [Flavobacteriales bacterium]
MRCLLIGFFCWPFFGLTQTVFFEKTYGTSMGDWTRGVIELPDGNIYTAGYSNGGPFGGVDICLTKLNKYGSVIWTKYFGDSLDNYSFSLILSSDTNLVLAGETNSAATLVDGWLMKVDTAGNELWSRYFASPVNESVYSVCQLTDGGYAMAGFINDTSGYNNEWILRTNDQGFLIWQKSLGGTNNDYAMGVAQTPEGHILTSADTKSAGAGGYDVELLKLDTAGNVLWNYVYGDSLQNGCQGLYITNANKYLVFGESENALFSPYDFMVFKTDTAGNQYRDTLTGGIYTDAVFSIVESIYADIVFTGYSASYSQGNNNLVLVKTDSVFAVNWIKSFGGPGVDIGYKVISSSLGGYIAAGTYTDSVTGAIHHYLIHVDENGEFLRINEPNEEPFLIFPNPADEKLCIETNEQHYLLQLINASGTCVFEKENGGNTELY